MDQKVLERRQRISTLGQIGLQQFAPYLMNRIMGRYNATLREDYGEGSSIMQERSHAFAMKSQVWLLDPRPNLPSIVKAVEDGFELSEASNTPVMLQVRIRCCHVHGHFIAKDNKRPSMTVAEALDAPPRDTGRIVPPPVSAFGQR